MDKLRVKIATKHGAVERKPIEDTKRQKALTDYRDMGWRVLGVPFGGPIKGRDLDGEAFHEDTEIWVKEGETVPLTYYHGFGPDDPEKAQDRPALIGKAVYTGMDDRGHWFDVHLDEEEELAQRVIDAGTVGIKASSGAVGHLTRDGLGGLIDVWPVGEIALFDTNDWRLPANDFAVIEAKTLDIPEAAAEADDAKAAAVETGAEPIIETETLVVEPLEETMSDEILETPAEPEVEQVDIDEKVKAAVEAALKAQPGIERGAPTVLKSAKIGDKDYKSEFYRYLRTGEVTRELKAAKAALQEGTTTEGGYAVPDDEFGNIVAKRDESSILSQLGVMRVQTRSDKFNFPYEDTSLTKFTIVAEEGAISAAEEEPTLGQVAVTVYKFNKLIKISEELLEDENSNLEAFLDNAIGRALADTENYYSLIGTGTAQPQGVFVGGTAGLTLDSATAIGAGEVSELMGKLGTPYQDRAAFVMDPATWFYLKGLTGTSVFTFGHEGRIGGRAWSGPVLEGHPVVLNSNVANIAASAKSMLFGNFDYLGVVTNRSFRVRRLNELYAGTGQVGILATMRWGCAVLQAEAFQYATQAAV